MKLNSAHAACAATLLSLAAFTAHAGGPTCISLAALDTAATQDFDTLATTGTANALTIPGWDLNETGGGARDNELYAADTGASNTGDAYSFGSAAATDRAFGALQSGTLIATWGACFVNNTGTTITSLDVAYRGEQWRLGTAARADRIDFQYSTDATLFTNGIWTDVDALDFSTPNQVTTGAKDGNAAGNFTAIAAAIPTLNITNGAIFWVRWVDFNATSSDDGLAVDDFSITPRGAAATSADLSVSVTDSPDPVNAGSNLTYTIAVGNAGPDAADAASLTATVGAGTTFVSLTPPAGGWTCTTPAVGAAGAISCSNASLAVGTGNFSLVVAVDAATADGTTLNQSVAVNSTTADPMGSNNTVTEDTTVGTSADLSISMTDTPNPVLAGGNLTYAFVVANAGPSNANTATWSHVMPAGTLLQSFVADPSWTCTTPAVGTNGTVTCNAASLAPSSGNFSLVVQVDPMAAAGSLINASATVSATTNDPDTANNTSTVATTVSAPSTISGTKSAAGTFAPGGSVTYTIVLSNSAASAQADNPGDEFVDVLPAGLSLVSATATSGTALATLGTNTVTWNGGIAAAGSVTITINATIDASVVNGVTINNQGTINFDADGNGSNEATALTDDPATATAGDATGIVIAGVIRGVPAASDWSKLLLMSALMLFAGLALRRQSA